MPNPLKAIARGQFSPSATIALGSFIVALTCFGARPLLAYQSRRVVIVIIDGPRLSESFEEPGHPHIPGLWDVLRPQGGYLPNFENQGSTYTLRGHASILTGTWQNIANDGSERPTQPTLFEYFRAGTGAPQSDAWLISGKEKLEACTYSVHPEYGAAYGASSNNVDRPDVDTYFAFKLYLGFYRPTLSMMSLTQTDIRGHLLDWDGYLQSISQADSLITDLWRWIQSNPALANTTTMIVTYDHGRHLDETLGFQNHGDYCLGCARIGFVALGPDFEPGSTGAALRNQRDICTTVAELLGFNVPYSEGNLLDEIFRDTAGIDMPDEILTGPHVIATLAAFPNPFNPALRISLTLEREARVLLDVQDVGGRHVRTLTSADLPRGRHSFVWDGTDGSGRPMASGVYYLVAESGGERRPEKVTLLR